MRRIGGRGDEAVLGAAAVAGEAHVAVEAVVRQLVELVLTELPLLRRVYGDYDRSPFTDESPAMIVVAEPSGA